VSNLAPITTWRGGGGCLRSPVEARLCGRQAMTNGIAWGTTWKPTMLSTGMPNNTKQTLQPPSPLSHYHNAHWVYIWVCQVILEHAYDLSLCCLTTRYFDTFHSLRSHIDHFLKLWMFESLNQLEKRKFSFEDIVQVINLPDYLVQTLLRCNFTWSYTSSSILPAGSRQVFLMCMFVD